MDNDVLDGLVTPLVPSLATSLSTQFNVFEVMHHGTHEKQLSNVFAWLLRSDASHELGDTFQTILMGRVNKHLPDDEQLPLSGYRISQEVDTAKGSESGRDIADILMVSEHAKVVVENYESSDGHGHSFDGYLEHGTADGGRGVVVLMCRRHEPHRQREGWEDAAVVTYADVLGDLRTHLKGDPAWVSAHPRQSTFINELIDYFTEVPGAMTDQDRVDFISAMCDAGEWNRFALNKQEQVAQEFADLVAEHAKRQFIEAKSALQTIKNSLRSFARSTLIPQVAEAVTIGRISTASVGFQGQWQWCISLPREDGQPTLFLVFGPTAAAEHGQFARPPEDPDYSRVFVMRSAGRDARDVMHQTRVGLDEVLAGLGPDDVRLRDAVIEVMRADSSA
ncbi:hypothetical protein ACSDQ9_01770 [Aestuariimicrobium soli]|uniref:hypothetical protein n=1 Tax=Aestuariimicrobium soli TaxID=2035834 RepID=UPI003EBA3FB1